MPAFRTEAEDKTLWCNLFHCSLYYEQAKEQTFCFYSSIIFFAKCAQFLIEIQIWMVLLIFLRYKVISPAAVSRLCFWRWNPSGVIKLTLRNVSKKEMNSCQSHSSLFIQPNNGNVWKSASRKVKWADFDDLFTATARRLNGRQAWQLRHTESRAQKLSRWLLCERMFKHWSPRYLSTTCFSGK